MFLIKTIIMTDLEAFYGHLGAILGGLEASWSNLGTFLSGLGAILDGQEAVLGGLGAVFGGLRAILASLGPFLERSWPLLRLGSQGSQWRRGPGAEVPLRCATAPQSAAT